jgi:hypothetical protein
LIPEAPVRIPDLSDSELETPVTIVKGEAMAVCMTCGVEKAAFMSDLCTRCVDKAIPAPKVERVPPAGTTRMPEKGSAASCIALGVVALLIGLFFLIDPSSGSPEYGMPHVANIHKLTLGQTFSIMGAIFLAAGLRPRG